VYDFQVHYCTGTSSTIWIANKLSYIPTQYTTIPKAENSERLVYSVVLWSINDLYFKFWQSKEYGNIINFLTDRVISLKNQKLGASQIRNI
jgi:hypothetical protein